MSGLPDNLYQTTPGFFSGPREICAPKVPLQGSHKVSPRDWHYFLNRKSGSVPFNEVQRRASPQEREVADRSSKRAASSPQCLRSRMWSEGKGQTKASTSPHPFTSVQTTVLDLAARTLTCRNNQTLP